MFLYLDSKNKVITYKENISKEDALALEEKGIGRYFSGKFSFLDGEYRKGFSKAFYLEEDGTIRLEYEPIPPRQPTEIETMQARLDYLAMMAG